MEQAKIQKCLERDGYSKEGKKNGNKEGSIQPRAQLMDHVPSPGVVSLTFFWL